MFKRLAQVILVLSILSLFSGCQQKESADGDLALLKTTDPPPISTEEDNQKEKKAKSIKDEVLALKEIYDVTVIIGQQDILVAYKVKHLHRFQMKSIEKKVNKILENKYQKENFFVSSDYKIFLEAVRLKDQIENNHISEREAEEKLQKIIKLKNEKT
jgi:Sporulation lipoprotein YhcN/YlaJ (Spore_YhcN_YlaJ)